ncbi:MAG: ABC transporter permease [Candidatus Methanofastidiosa archaeon]|nr:ABC transporter permease [Candidatus Methanofastidiosa archaeon]
MVSELSKGVRLSRELHTIRYILKKELKLWKRYPSRILFILIMPFLSILTLYFQGMGLVGGTQSSEFESFAGTQDYLVFIILGSAVFIFVSTAIWGVGNSIRREQMMGTLESIWVTPTSKITIFVGVALFDGLFSSYVAFMQLLISSLILPVNLIDLRLFVIIGIAFLLIFALYGLGFFFTGFVLIYKELEDFTNMITSAIKMVTPVSYPLSVLPAPVAFIALFIPLTYALQAIRKYMGVGESGSLYQYLGLLLVFDLIFLVVGSLFFRYAERSAKRRGAIATY